MERRGSGYTVVFLLVDLPPEADFVRWSETLTFLLTRNRGSSSWWWVKPDGTVTLTTADGVAASADHLNALDDAVRQVEQVIEQQELDEAKQREDSDAERARMETELDGVRAQVPDWIESISWGPSGSHGRGPSWVFSVRNVDDLLGPTITPSIRSPASAVADALRESALVDQCYDNAGGSLTLEPALNVDDLLTVLASANETVAAYLTELDAHRKEQTAAIAEVRAELAKAMSLRDRHR